MTDTSVVFNILAKDNASGVMGKIGGAAKGLMGAFAVGIGLDQIRDAIGKASDLAETQSKVNVLFGSVGAAALDTWAAHADTAMGQSKQQALDAAATFGVFAKSAGLSGAGAVDFSTKMTTLASDMASFSNTSPQEAIEAIGSALQGEMEPIRKYGVLLDDASMRQQALKMGLIKTTTQALTPQQKVLTAQALILAQTSAAQGDFARTSTGAANKSRIQAAELENLKTKIGAGLLPAYSGLLSVGLKVIGFLEKNSSWVGPLAIGLGILAVGVWAVTAAQTAWNVAMALNPVGLIIIAVVALVAAIIYLWFHSAAFRQFFINLWQDIWGFLKAVGGWFAGPFANFFVNAYQAIITGTRMVVDWIHARWDEIWGFLKGVGHWFAHDFAGFFAATYRAIMHGIDEAGQWVRGKWDALVGFVSGIPGRISSAVSGMWNGIKDAFRSAINWVIGRWNSLHFTIPSISFAGFSTPSFSFGVPSIPYVEAGGVATRRGLAVVGERGAELVSLPAGAAVYPHGSVPGDMMATGGHQVLQMRVVGNADSGLATFLHALARQGILQFELAS